jgi:predicted aspartyl protease
LTPIVAPSEKPQENFISSPGHLQGATGTSSLERSKGEEMPAWFVGALQLLALVQQGEGIGLDLYRDHAVVVEGSIAGLDGLRFIIDTGACPSVIHKRLARKLRLATRPDALHVVTGSVGLECAIVPELRLGPARVNDLEVLVYDLSPIERQMGTRIDAIVGIDVLSLCNLRIDYERRRLSFQPMPTPPAVLMDLRRGFIGVSVEVLGQNLYLMVDTGAKDVVLFENRIRDRLPQLPVVGRKIVLGLGGNQLLSKLDLPYIRIGAQRIGPIRAYAATAADESIPGFDGLLGLRGLGVNLLVIDFQRRLVGLSADEGAAARLRDEP